MHVLAVGNMYPPHHLGGYELVWRSAMRHLRARGHAVRVLTTDFRGDTAERDDADVFRELHWYWRDHEFPRLGWRETLALERHNRAVLERHLEQFAPDVVSWWAMGGMSLSLLAHVRRAGLPAVAFVADDWLLYGPKVDRFTRRLHRRLDLTAAARYVFISESVRRAAGIPGEIAPLGVDPAFLDPRPERTWAWRLLYVGRIDPRKGIEDAVLALAALGEPGATLTIAGDGDPRELERLRARIASLGLGERVRLLGMLTHAELPAIYEAADAVLFPVRWAEPQGLVPLEAMALGRPVIATGAGGSAEYLRDGENCLVVEPGQPARLAGAVRRLEADPRLRARLRAGGIDTAARYTEPIFNARVEEALVTWLRRSRPS